MMRLLPILLAQLLFFGLGDEIGCAADEQIAAAVQQDSAASVPVDSLHLA